MSYKLNTQEKQMILEVVKNVLKTGKRWDDESQHFPADAIIETVLAIEGMKKGPDTDDARDGFSTNGWAWDWWQTFVFEGKQYTLSGSGFYGGHSFGIWEE